MKKMIKIVLTAALAVAVSACSSAQKVRYVNPNEVNRTTVEFNQTDLQNIASTMVGSLLSSKSVVRLTEDHSRPVMYIDHLRNMTDEHIDMEAINNTISTKLIQSDQFRFLDMQVTTEVTKQLHYQRDSALVDPESAVKIGHQLGAHYMLYGTLTNMVQKTEKVTDVSFLMTMKLMNLQTGIIEWQDQKQIRKVATRSTFGF